jgi:DNA primase
MNDVVEEIKTRVDIVDLVGRYVNIKKSGSNYKANCPFHNENTPSFMVSPSLQIYKCFGCAKSGDAISFLMEMEGIDFSEAIQRLGEEVGVDTSTIKKGPNKKQFEYLFKINELTNKFYVYTLHNLPVGKEAKKYLKNRGLSTKHIEEFNFGYAPNSWDSLHNFLIKKGFTNTQIESAGLIKQAKGGKYYDSFRGRITFPLINEKNEMVGFSGRTIINEDPKYLNIKNTPVFNKSSFVFNLDKAKVEIKKKKQVVVCEGPFDAVTPYTKGIKNIVALQGTSFTSEQAKLLKRFAEEAIMFFDRDDAGVEAALRGITTAQNTGLDVKIAEIEGKFKDPDEAANKSIDILIKAIDNAIPAYDFYFLYATKKFDETNALEKSKIVNFLKPKINVINDPVLKAHYTKKLAELVDVPEDTLKITSQETKTNVVEEKQRKTSKNTNLLLMYLLKADKNIYKNVIEEVKVEKLLSKKDLKILQEYESSVIEGKTTKQDFINKSKYKEKLVDIDLTNVGDFEESIEIQTKTLKTLIKKEKQHKIKGELDILKDKIKQAERLNEAKKLDKYQKKFNILARSLSNIH